MSIDVNQLDLTKFPSVIRGCWFPDGWEFGAPTVIYSPFFAYSPNGGNASEIYNLIESILIDISIDPQDLNKILSAHRVFVKAECKWRGWSMYGFKNRIQAWHQEFHIRWFIKRDELHFEVPVVVKRRGPFPVECKAPLTKS